MLPGNVEQREPWPAENRFFRKRRDVAGMVADDGRVVLNPYTDLSESQRAAVALNEAARVFMERERLYPEFDLTPAQKLAFAAYGPVEAQRATIAGRILSQDPSALVSTAEQEYFVRRLAEAMGIA